MPLPDTRADIWRLPSADDKALPPSAAPSSSPAGSHAARDLPASDARSAELSSGVVLKGEGRRVCGEL